MFCPSCGAEILETEAICPACGAATKPATETPVTETPATEAPVTEAPVTETPATETPVTEAPVTETPVTEAPAMETLSFKKRSKAPVIIAVVLAVLLFLTAGFAVASYFVKDVDVFKIFHKESEDMDLAQAAALAAFNAGNVDYDYDAFLQSCPPSARDSARSSMLESYGTENEDDLRDYFASRKAEAAEFLISNVETALAKTYTRAEIENYFANYASDTDVFTANDFQAMADVTVTCDLNYLGEDYPDYALTYVVAYVDGGWYYITMLA